jgi:hypothetical protein
MIWSEIRKWQQEQKLAVVGLAVPSRNCLDDLEILYVCCYIRVVIETAWFL